MSVKRSISCVDLFCGAGGLTHGLIQEGIDVTAGIDLDPICRYPYEANNKDAVFIERNISEVSSKEVESYFLPGSLRVLAGCAPCQPFSSYTQRYDMKRNDKWVLLKEFQRLAEDIRPDMVTMENVPSIREHNVFARFVKSLKELRYNVWYEVVNCMDYGVPQTRKRTVLLASRHGEISMIDKTHPVPVTVKQSIGRLRSLAAGEQAPRDPLHVAASLSDKNLARIKYSKPGGTWKDWPTHLVADCHKAKTGKTFSGVYGRMEWNKPGPTMTTQCYGYGNGRFGHPEQNRAISLREAAILQGFSRDYKFVSPKDNVEFIKIGRLIGNAVPVYLGRAIAQSIKLHANATDAVPKRMGRLV